MADLSQFTDQERVLLAQYLALKSGGIGNAPAALQMVLDRLESGQHGSTLYEVVAGLLPDGIPMGTDYSEYLEFVNTGQVPQPPAPPAPPVDSGDDGDSGSDYSPAQMSLNNGGVTITHGLLPILEKLGLPIPGQEPRPPLSFEEGGMFGVPMSPAIPPQGPPPPVRPQTPMYPDEPIRVRDPVGPGPGPMSDPRTTNLAPPPSARVASAAPIPPLPIPEPLAIPAPAQTALRPPTPATRPVAAQPQAPIAPPALPPLPPEYQPAGSINPDKTEDRLASVVPELDPSATVDPFQYVQPPPDRPGRLSAEYTPSPSPPRPTTQPLNTRSVQPVSINPQTGGLTDLPGLRRDALARDLSGPIDSEAADNAISMLTRLLSTAAPAPVEQRAMREPENPLPALRLPDVLSPQAAPPLAAPGAGVSPQQRNAMSALPHPSDMIPPIREPALTEHVLRDWVRGGGLERPAAAPDMRTITIQPEFADAGAQPGSPQGVPQGTAAAVPQGMAGSVPQRTIVGREPPPLPRPREEPPSAPLPAARMAVAEIIPEEIDLSLNDRELIARAVATEVDPRIARSNPAAYRQQVYRVVDVMLNRVASPEFPNTVAEVLNQPRQFSAITGPKSKKGERYGAVENIPAERADPALRNVISEWLGERWSGEPSSVGGALHYANPKAADARNLVGWINDLDGPRDNAGPFSHWYGTTEGYEPFEARVRNPARDSLQSSTGEPWLAAAAASQQQQRGSQEALGAAFTAAVASAAQDSQRRASVSREVGSTYSPAGSSGSGDRRGSRSSRSNGDSGSGGDGGSYSPAGPFTSPTQSVRSPTGKSITVAERNAFGGYSSPGRSTSPTQRVTSPTGKSITVAQRDAFGGYTTPSPSKTTTTRSSGKKTSPTQRVTTPTGGTVTVAQRNAFGGY